jgi:hypothetical protein
MAFRRFVSSLLVIRESALPTVVRERLEVRALGRVAVAAVVEDYDVVALDVRLWEKANGATAGRSWRCGRR